MAPYTRVTVSCDGHGDPTPPKVYFKQSFMDRFANLRFIAHCLELRAQREETSALEDGDQHENDTGDGVDLSWQSLDKLLDVERQWAQLINMIPALKKGAPVLNEDGSYVHQPCLQDIRGYVRLAVDSIQYSVDVANDLNEKSSFKSGLITHYIKHKEQDDELRRNYLVDYIDRLAKCEVAARADWEKTFKKDTAALKAAEKRMARLWAEKMTQGPENEELSDKENYESRSESGSTLSWAFNQSVED
ncbi:hypothetical protein M011DRAFT_52263 [Sporormia fimetaria CBS 119925]|uniref:Uncharacterized protein n=1 Tax=Sporormia fimetaria CBS 119925 TaxID=1340428 RepID=A0A6A6V9N0_9PLEO|nr:hypothetical protein M011DRAFT_52263 [Sporormia fimetaria CBS 119925]